MEFEVLAALANSHAFCIKAIYRYKALAIFTLSEYCEDMSTLQPRQSPKTVLQPLDAPRAIVKALGGTGKVAALTNKSAPAISNAIRRGHFPPDSYAVMSEALSALGYTAPAHLWRQVGCSQQAEVA